MCIPVWQSAYARGPQRAVGRAAVAAMRVIVERRIKVRKRAVDWGCSLVEELVRWTLRRSSCFYELRVLESGRVSCCGALGA